MRAFDYRVIYLFCFSMCNIQNFIFIKKFSNRILPKIYINQFYTCWFLKIFLYTCMSTLSILISTFNDTIYYRVGPFWNFTSLHVVGGYWANIKPCETWKGVCNLKSTSARGYEISPPPLQGWNLRFLKT